MKSVMMLVPRMRNIRQCCSGIITVEYIICRPQIHYRQKLGGLGYNYPNPREIGTGTVLHFLKKLHHLLDKVMWLGTYHRVGLDVVAPECKTATERQPVPMVWLQFAVFSN